MFQKPALHTLRFKKYMKMDLFNRWTCKIIIFLIPSAVILTIKIVYIQILGGAE